MKSFSFKVVREHIKKMNEKEKEKKKERESILVGGN